MRIIEIQENKLSSLAEHVEKGLRYLGKAMQCIDELQGGGERKSEYGERWDDDDFDRDERMRIEGGSRYGGSRYGTRRYR